ncbi:MAG: DUF4234 domain-containing protein [Acidimicrobiales bacterium]|nr:DUF4234 domain-containing protein [Acidimicrobiales bacterium]
MSDFSQGPGWWLASDGKWYPPQPPSASPPMPGANYPMPGGGYGGYGGHPGYSGYGGYPMYGRLGKPENIGTQILLSILTFGLYGVYWAYKCHEEIKVHTGEGVGGALGAVIYFFVGIVTLFLLPIEIEKMYHRDGRQSPVSAATAFWSLLFVIPWYVKCQQALNDYWISKGAPPA